MKTSIRPLAHHLKMGARERLLRIYRKNPSSWKAGRPSNRPVWGRTVALELLAVRPLRRESAALEIDFD
jgi:hypothetical protein